MSGANTRHPINYRGYELNSRFDKTGDLDRDAVDSGYFTKVELFDFSRMQQRDQREGLHLLSGGDFGVASDVFRFISLRGAISAGNDDDDELEDQQSRLIRAFEVEEAQIDSPDTVGAAVLDFWTPTHHPPFGLRSPVHEYFLCRPVAYPALYEREASDMTVKYAVELVCADPRRYLYDETVVEFTTADGWTQDLPNWTDDMGRTVYPSIRVVTTGAGDTNFTISAGGSQVLILDLSSSDGVQIDIDCFTGTITKSNGTRKDDWRTSSVATIPFGLPAGGATWHMAHRQGVDRVTVSYHQCRS